MPSPSQRPRERLRTGSEEMIGAGTGSPSFQGTPVPQLWACALVRSSACSTSWPDQPQSSSGVVGVVVRVVVVPVRVVVVVRVTVAVAALQVGRVHRLHDREDRAGPRRCPGA